MTRPRAVVPPTGDRLRQSLSDTLVAAMIPYVAGWIETLGKAGSLRNKRVSAATRVNAAKTGIELVTKFMASGTSVSGDELLRQLASLEEELESLQVPGEGDDDGEEDAAESDGSQGSDWAEDPQLPGQETDLD